MMVNNLPPYRPYSKSKRIKRYAMYVSDGMLGDTWGIVTARGNTSILHLPYGADLDLSETPEYLRSQFLADGLADMMDNFL